MERTILVAYASEFGSTQQIAETIGAELRTPQTTVEVRSVLDIQSVESYQAVVVGSAIYNGAWLPEAVEFVRVYAASLAHKPVAYFAVSMMMREDTPQHRELVRSYLDAVRAAAPTITPVSVGLFAGALNYHNLPLPERIRFWLTSRLPGGDYRQWTTIRQWAARLPLHAEAPYRASGGDIST